MSVRTDASATGFPTSVVTFSDGETSPSSSDEKSGTAVADSASTEETHPHRDLLVDACRDARLIIRFIQCPICSHILQDPTTLPCGSSICRACLPATQHRANISWPATPGRSQGFRCPLPNCDREHAVADCGFDVTLNNILDVVRKIIKPAKSTTDSLQWSTHITVRDSWVVAGVSSLQEKEPESKAVHGGRILATYTLADLGDLDYNAEVSYSTVGASEDEVGEEDVSLFLELQGSVRSEVDCQVCYAIFLDPVTTACGHTYCRGCLHRILDHSNLCPTCRSPISLQAQVNARSAPSNKSLISIINRFWSDQVAQRDYSYQLEQKAESGGFDIPIFVCTLSFPSMPLFLHVFEPRYRLMIRRAMEGNRTFGMVLNRPRPGPDEPEFMELGVLLRIVRIEFFNDGRSLLETIGVSRFKITRHGLLDGYTVANIEKVDDISLAEEEAIEASEVGQRTSAHASDTTSTTTPSRPAILAASDLDTVSTREMLEFSISFVRTMQAQSVHWLATRMLTIYGECPDDPATFPWWFACILPVKDAEKYKLLGTSSVRNRMKMCCRWILEWQESSVSICIPILFRPSSHSWTATNSLRAPDLGIFGIGY
jgi:hypothetical protein